MKQVRKADRLIWAVDGVVEKKLHVVVIADLLRKFKKIDVVPTHYNYPELYAFWLN